MRSDITLYFVRHGETDWNKAQRYQGQTDIPLNDLGRAQARRNGEALRGEIGHLLEQHDFVASPLSRAAETMALVREGLGLAREPFRRDDRLKEQHFGHWEGLLWSELPTLDPDGFESRRADMWGWTPRGGENYEMVRVRVLEWLDGLTRDTVAVSHGNISRSVRGILLGIDRTAVPRLEVPQDKVLRIRGGVATWI